MPAEGGERMTSTSRPTVDGKKVRFGGGPARDDSEDDDVEPADDLEGPSGRRKAVIKPADGGSSDEESEEEPARDDDDDDMFNSSKAKDVKKDDSSKVRDKGLQLREGAETTSSKGEHYLKLGDLEGQEFNMPDASDSEDEELPEGEDEDANADDAPRSKRSKKGMGYTLSGFNMKQELQEGRMTSDGCERSLTVDVATEFIYTRNGLQRTWLTRPIRLPDTTLGWMPLWRTKKR